MGTLYVVATPIGNLEDVTLRALRVLGEADLVLAEDTRHTRILLDRHGIAARPRSLHAHNEAQRSAEVLEALAQGSRVALVSDAGTPLISDPGDRLVHAALAAGHTLVPVPGPSAVLGALVVSGLPTAPFTFLGFLPRKRSERQRLLEAFREAPATLVFFESPKRVANTLDALVEALGDRPACVARELTKLHEEVVRGNLADLRAHFDTPPRGEVTLVVAGAAPEVLAGAELEMAVRRLVREGAHAKEVAAALTPRAEATHSEVYAMAVAAAEERR